MAIFADDDDRLAYIRRLRFHSRLEGVAIVGFCLMPNHVHLIARPEYDDSLARCLRRAHSEYAQSFNERTGRVGHLFQNRFYSCVLEKRHALNALRYVDLNPVRASLVKTAKDWRWSSASAHIGKRPDEFGLLSTEWLLWRDCPDWEELLRVADDPEEDALIRQHTRSSRPFGSFAFVKDLEQRTRRRIGLLPPGRLRGYATSA